MVLGFYTLHLKKGAGNVTAIHHI